LDLDWDIGPTGMLVITVSADGDLYYAYLGNESRMRGRERATGVLPEAIELALARLSRNAYSNYSVGDAGAIPQRG
jgi:hypothetical protein